MIEVVKSRFSTSLLCWAFQGESDMKHKHLHLCHEFSLVRGQINRPFVSDREAIFIIDKFSRQDVGDTHYNNYKQVAIYCSPLHPFLFLTEICYLFLKLWPSIIMHKLPASPIL